MSLLMEARLATEQFGVAAESLARQVSELQSLCVLLGNGDINNEKLLEIVQRVDEVEDRLITLESHVKEDMDQVQQAAVVVERLKNLEAKAKLLGNAFYDGDDAENDEQECPEDESNAPENDAQGQDDGEEEEIAVVTRDENDRIIITCPSEDQLNKVPKYMRGRLTTEKLEQAVQVITQAFQHKEATMNIPRAQQSVTVRESVLQWRNQESEETAGLFFVSRDDIFTQAAKSGSVDTNLLKAALQVLRYCNILRLVNGAGGMSLYCVEQN